MLPGAGGLAAQNPTQRDRFFALVDKVGKEIDKSVSGANIGDGFRPGLFQSVVQDLVRFWNGEGRVRTVGQS